MPSKEGICEEVTGTPIKRKAEMARRMQTQPGCTRPSGLILSMTRPR